MPLTKPPGSHRKISEHVAAIPGENAPAEGFDIRHLPPNELGVLSV